MFFRKRQEAVKACHLFAYIRERRDRWTVKEMCEVLAVSESGYYRGLNPTPKRERHQHLLVKIKGIIEEYEDNSNYGAWRIVLALAQKEIVTSYSTIYRIMKTRPAEESKASSKRHYTRGCGSSKEREPDSERLQRPSTEQEVAIGYHRGPLFRR